MKVRVIPTEDRVISPEQGKLYINKIVGGCIILCCDSTCPDTFDGVVLYDSNRRGIGEYLTRLPNDNYKLFSGKIEMEQ